MPTLQFSNYLIILVGLLLIFLVSTFLISSLHHTRKKSYNIYDKHIQSLNTEIQNKKRQLEQLTNKIEKHQPRTTSKQRHEEVVDTLDWMLQYQIITPSEYNQLITKSLPYLN